MLAALPRQTLTGAQIAEYCGTTCPPELADRQFDLKRPDREALHAFFGSCPPGRRRRGHSLSVCAGHLPRRFPC
ncbi:hypothetical protein NIA69_14765 [Gemmiger formicilis]|nr:hypothetical protein [Gemmiger formicilis]